MKFCSSLATEHKKRHVNYKYSSYWGADITATRTQKSFRLFLFSALIDKAIAFPYRYSNQRLYSVIAALSDIRRRQREKNKELAILRYSNL